MSNLVQIDANRSNNNAQGGLGIDSNSRLFALKPATLGIIQQNSQVEGKKGSLRVSETGDVFDSINVVLLGTPQERRDYYAGEAGAMNKVPANLLCFSRDMEAPDQNARFPQAALCAGCKNADWTAYQEFKAANQGQVNKQLAPSCEKSWFATILDTTYRLPLRIFPKGKSIKPFEAGMSNLYRTLTLAKAQGKNPSIFDVKFTLGTEKITTGKFVSYVFKLSNFTFATAEESEAYSQIYQEYISQFNKPNLQQAAPGQNHNQNHGLTSVYQQEFIDEEDVAA